MSSMSSSGSPVDGKNKRKEEKQRKNKEKEQDVGSVTTSARYSGSNQLFRIKPDTPDRSRYSGLIQVSGDATVLPWDRSTGLTD